MGHKIQTMIADLDKVESFLDCDGMGTVVVGWKSDRQSLLHVGSNTEANRELGKFVADAIREKLASHEDHHEEPSTTNQEPQ